MKLGEKIYQHRRRMGLSQEELAERLGVTRQAVSKWEVGTSVPELETVVALARTFGVTTDYLLTDEPAAQAPPAYQAQPQQSQPDWLDRLPGFIGKMFKRFGWLAGVYMMVSGAGFAAIGALARYISRSMFSSFSDSFTTVSGGFDSFYGMGSVVTDPFSQQINAMAANNPVSILGGFLMVFGILLMIAGAVLAIYLKKKAGQ